MLLNHVILALLWMVYCMLHSLMASVGIKNWLEKISGSSYRYYRLFYSLFSFFFLVIVLYFQFMLPTMMLYKVPAPIFAFGAVLGLSGLVLMLFCIKKYFMSLSGLRSLVHETTYNDLLITGIHRYVRHPLYLGTFAFIWGFFLVKPYLSLLIANSIITVYTLIGIKLEEDKLIGEFGESYKNYQQSVPKLLPFRRVKQKV
jgi:methanethiol S-methyltransferase